MRCSYGQAVGTGRQNVPWDHGGSPLSVFLGHFRLPKGNQSASEGQCPTECMGLSPNSLPWNSSAAIPTQAALQRRLKSRVGSIQGHCLFLLVQSSLSFLVFQRFHMEHCSVLTCQHSVSSI